MKVRQRGQKTYIRFKIRAIFEEEDFLDNEFSRMCKEIESQLDYVSTTFDVFESWTKLGPSGRIKVVDRKEKQIILEISVNRSGWTIRIDTINHSEFFPQISKKVFGNKNSRAAWTQQTSLVVPMTIELIEELRGELNA
jgi:hypothetical protein